MGKEERQQKKHAKKIPEPIKLINIDAKELEEIIAELKRYQRLGKIGFLSFRIERGSSPPSSAEAEAFGR